ncbi:MAG: hypothetical protein JWM31_53 [Solirubrobacterales bacterium]|nr:hypothetical protein [Solirubrobacterales bacterium]
MSGLEKHINAAEKAVHAQRDEATRREREIAAVTAKKRAEVEALVEEFLDQMEVAGNPGLTEFQPGAPRVQVGWVVSNPRLGLVDLPAVAPSGELLWSFEYEDPHVGRTTSYIGPFPWSDFGHVQALSTADFGRGLASVLVTHDAQHLKPGPGIRREQWKQRAPKEFLRLISQADFHGALTAPTAWRGSELGPQLRYWRVGSFEKYKSDASGGYWTCDAFFCEDETLRAKSYVSCKTRFGKQKRVDALGPPDSSLMASDAVNEALLKIALEAGLDLGLISRSTGS